MEKGKLLITGLYTDPNKWSSVPDGALSRASNIVIDRMNIATSRRGFLQGEQLTDPRKYFEYKTKVYVLDGVTLKRDDSGVYNSVGTTTPIAADILLHSTVNGESMLITSNEGVQVIDSITGSLRPAGVAPALEIRLTAIAGTTITSGSYVRYRLVYAKTLENGRLILGAPSYSATAQATGGNRTFTIDSSLPAGIDATWNVQLFRSFESITDPASDELFQVADRLVTGAEVIAGVVTITDTTDEDDLGVSLYTNPTLGGISLSKYPPPRANDIFTYQSYTFYCNFTQKHLMLATVTSLYILNDTITIDGNVFTAKAAENIGAQEFKIETTIEATINSIVRVINRNALTFKATQLSETVFQIERISFANPSFTASGTKIVYSNNGTSENSGFGDAMVVSELLEPESIPLNPPPFRIGQSDKAIIRGLAVRDAAYLLKEDGAFRISGLTPETFQVEALDNTFECVAAETAVVFSNQIFCLTSKGIMVINANGVAMLSEPIDNVVSLALGVSTLSEKAFGVAFDRDQRYIIGLPTSQDPDNVRNIFVFNGKTGSWTTWDLRVKHGLATRNSNDLRFIRNDGYLLTERKTYTLADYADDEFAVTITGVTTNDITVNSVTDLTVGMLLKQGIFKSLITVINGNVLTVIDGDGFTNAAAIVYKPIQCDMAWSLEHSANAGVLKHIQEATLLFEDARFESFVFSTTSNFSKNNRAVTVLNSNSYPWGAFPWGSILWGGTTGGPQPFRIMLHREHRRALWVTFTISHASVFSSFDFSGLIYQFQGMSRIFK